MGNIASHVANDSDDPSSPQEALPEHERNDNIAERVADVGSVPAKRLTTPVTA